MGARSKDHDLSHPAPITAYAIGIRSTSGKERVIHTIQSTMGNTAAHPSAHVTLPTGWTLSGGGALDQWNGAGNLLTATYPVGQGWSAAGKDHQVSLPAAITAYAIGIRAA